MPSGSEWPMRPIDRSLYLYFSLVSYRKCSSVVCNKTGEVWYPQACHDQTLKYVCTTRYTVYSREVSVKKSPRHDFSFCFVGVFTRCLQPCHVPCLPCRPFACLVDATTLCCVVFATSICAMLAGASRWTPRLPLRPPLRLPPLLRRRRSSPRTRSTCNHGEGKSGEGGCIDKNLSFFVSRFLLVAFFVRRLVQRAV